MRERTGEEPGPPAGWYRDPGGTHEYRWWDGSGWTPTVADGEAIGQDWPSAGAPPPGPGGPAPAPDERARLPRRASLLAVGGIAAGLLLSAVGSAVAAVAVPHSRAALILLSLAGLWTGLLGAVWTASRRFGTGDVRRDFGARLAGGDLGRGVVVALVGRVAGVVLVLPIVAANRKFAGSDLKPFEGARNDPALLAIVVVLVLVGAPFVEELFFRGLLLRSLLPLLGSTGAIAVQAVLFAAMHLRPSYGPGNVSLVVAIGAMGVLQGIVAERYRRLGPVVVAHGLFNLPGLLSIAAR